MAEQMLKCAVVLAELVVRLPTACECAVVWAELVVHLPTACALSCVRV